MAGSREKVSFTGATGAALDAALELPAGPPRAYALFAHCFTCSKDNFAARRISEALAGHGIATLRFDFTGLGHSEGDFANTDFSSNVGDLVAAAGFLRETRQAPVILVGHSLGGTAVLKAAAEIPEAAAVATIGAPSTPAHLKRLLAPATPEIEKSGAATVEIAGRGFTITRSFLDDIADQAMDEAIGGLRRALLVTHSPLDAVVSIDCASAIFRAAKHPKSFLSLDDADHLLTRRADAAYVAGVLAAWAGRYVPEPATSERATEDGAVVVRENGAGRFGQDIVMGPHLMTADEPESAGGRGAGPTPYQLLSAALGACTSMTMRMYAEHKKWPLERATVTVRHDKIHAEDCADCETREGRVDLFEREIVLEGPLDDEQRGRILEIADKCPVHRTLNSEIRVRTRPAEN